MGQNQQIYINNEYITLGQFIKIIGLISTGGEVKSFLLNNIVEINKNKENRRGKKIYKGDLIKINDKEYIVCW